MRRSAANAASLASIVSRASKIAWMSAKAELGDRDASARENGQNMLAREALNCLTYGRPPNTETINEILFVQDHARSQHAGNDQFPQSTIRRLSRGLYFGVRTLASY